MKGVEIRKDHPLLKEVLTEEALRFVVALHLRVCGHGQERTCGAGRPCISHRNW